ncbi:hypothetical protein Tco_0126906 [Tanacetum coccineum]
MSGLLKKVSDVGFKASKIIDWDGMAKMIVKDEAKKCSPHFVVLLKKLIPLFKPNSVRWYPFINDVCVVCGLKGACLVVGLCSVLVVAMAMGFGGGGFVVEILNVTC